MMGVMGWHSLPSNWVNMSTLFLRDLPVIARTRGCGAICHVAAWEALGASLIDAGFSSCCSRLAFGSHSNSLLLWVAMLAERERGESE